MRDVLVDETQPAGRVDHDVAQAVLTDDATLQVAELWRVLFIERRRDSGGLLPQRRLHDRGLLKERREVGHGGARFVIPLRREEPTTGRFGPGRLRIHRFAQELTPLLGAA